MLIHGIVLILLAAGITAQDTKPAVASDWTKLTAYNEAQSRQAFAACDANADDRLHLLEALKTLSGMGSLQQPEGFRQLDLNRDGHLDWTEFDRNFQQAVQHGRPLQIRPTHPRILTQHHTAAAASSESPSQRAGRTVIHLGDQDRDG